MSIDRVPKTIISCAVLHNVVKHFNDVLHYDVENDDNRNALDGEEVAVKEFQNEQLKLQG